MYLSEDSGGATAKTEEDPGSSAGRFLMYRSQIFVVVSGSEVYKKTSDSPAEDPQSPRLRNNNHLYNFAAVLFLNGVSDLDSDRIPARVFG